MPEKLVRGLTNPVIYASSDIDSRESDKYPELLKAIQDTYDAHVDGTTKLFRTNSYTLYCDFLDNIDPTARQHYNCNTCRSFVRHYGNMVKINPDGSLTSVLWDETRVPEFFKTSVEVMRKDVEGSHVMGSFIYDATSPSDTVVGRASCGNYDHMHVVMDASTSAQVLNLNKHRTAHQVMADYDERQRMLNTVLQTYNKSEVSTAVNILSTDALNRSEKFLGNAKWLFDCIKTLENLATTKPEHFWRRKKRVIWLATVTAPTGFCNVRSGMLGTLLDDIHDGLSLDTIKERFNAKVEPTKYQRPQAAPTAGNIKRAEELIEQLGIAKSLERRFACIDELPGMIWKPIEKPVVESTASTGVFSHLTPKDTKAADSSSDIVPAATMSMVKFMRDVLPTATEIYIEAPSLGQYSGILTALHEDAPPILKWDNAQHRNPFSWYVYNRPSTRDNWNINSGYVKVSGLVNRPCNVNGPYPGEIQGCLIIIDGAKDVRYKDGAGQGNALFPEDMRSELHEVRSTIEAYSDSATIFGYESASACGLMCNEHSTDHIKLKVTNDYGTAIYTIARYE